MYSLYFLDVDKIDVELFFVGDNIDIFNMNFCVFFGYFINKNYVKYGELFLLNMFVELGGILYNFDLVCYLVYYISCFIVGFNKLYIEKFLYLDGINDYIIFINICGKE